jgi:hypothetical protein
MHMSGRLGTTSRIDGDSGLELTVVRPTDSQPTSALAVRELADPEPADLTLYLVQVPQGWELRS